MKNKINEVRKEMKKRNLDGFLFSSKLNKRYILGFSGIFNWVFITTKNAYLIGDQILMEKESLKYKDFNIVISDMQIEYIVKKIAEKEGLGKVGFEEHFISFEQYRKLSYVIEECGDYSNLVYLAPIGDLIESIMARDTNKNKNFIKKAQEIGDRAFRKVINTAYEFSTDDEALDYIRWCNKELEEKW